jgi:type VI secretion system Hcp family effector
MSIYLKMPNISGNATDKNHQGWILLDHVSMKMNKSIKHQVGFGEPRETSTPKFQELFLTKRADAASGDLYHLACSSKTVSSARIHACHQTDTGVPYVEYILSDVMVSSFEDQLTEEGLPTELLTLSYLKIERSYQNKSASGSLYAPKRVGYDLTKAQIA